MLCQSDDFLGLLSTRACQCCHAKRFDTEAGVLTKNGVLLSQDLEPVIIPVADRVGELRVAFPGYTPVLPP